jgi:uncharacterized protein YecE (DUF72 family)
MGLILIGTSSWADPALVKSGFYPPEIKSPEERLRHYAAGFLLAEMDSSYHFLPTRRNLSLWLAATPPGFVFDVKAFSLFTGHPTQLNAFPRDIRESVEKVSAGSRTVYLDKLPRDIAEAMWDRFRVALNPIAEAGKLGLVMFQFPPWFHCSPQHYDRILLCREKLSAYHLAVEFRTGDWLNESNRDQTLRFLRANELSLVCVDEPQGLKSSVPSIFEVTARLAAMRFHGRNKEKWEEKRVPAVDRFNYLYSEAELMESVPGIRLMAQQSDAVHVVFKTKPADLAVQNALQMQKILS